MGLESALFDCAMVVGLALLSQWLAWWLKLPAILFLLLSGIVIGPVSGLFEPDKVLGPVMMPFITLAVAIILFEGSLTLKFSDIRGHGRTVTRLVTVGYGVTWIGTLLALHYVLNFAWEVSALLAAIVSVSGPTVIQPLLRTVRPTQKISNILRWEGILIDPLGAVFAVLVFVVLSRFDSASNISGFLVLFCLTLAGGVCTGIVAGFGLGWLLKRHWIPEYLQNITVLTAVIVAFVFGDHLMSGTGLVAVTVMGVWLANEKDMHLVDIVNFKEHLSLILLSLLFIILAARIDLKSLWHLGWPLVGFLVVIQFVIRPLSVFLNTLGSDLSWSERYFLGWVMPRGIVAAAVGAIFAAQLGTYDFAGVHYIVVVSFAVIVFTVILQSLTARPLAELLKVREPEAKGFLVVGANPVSLLIAKFLLEKELRVMMVDQSWAPIRQARMQGVPCYYGHPVSEAADKKLDLVGIGGLLALSEDDDLNTISTLRYRPEFGSRYTFTLGQHNYDAEVKHKVAKNFRGRRLFGESVSYSSLLKLIEEGAELKQTKLTEQFTFQDYIVKYQNLALTLFAFDPRGRFHVVTAEMGVDLKPGWSIVSLVKQNKEWEKDSE